MNEEANAIQPVILMQDRKRLNVTNVDKKLKKGSICWPPFMANPNPRWQLSQEWSAASLKESQPQLIKLAA